MRSTSSSSVPHCGRSIRREQPCERARSERRAEWALAREEHSAIFEEAAARGVSPSRAVATPKEVVLEPVQVEVPSLLLPGRDERATPAFETAWSDGSKPKGAATAGAGDLGLGSASVRAISAQQSPRSDSVSARTSESPRRGCCRSPPACRKAVESVPSQTWLPKGIGRSPQRAGSRPPRSSTADAPRAAAAPVRPAASDGDHSWVSRTSAGPIAREPASSRAALASSVSSSSASSLVPNTPNTPHASASHALDHASRVARDERLRPRAAARGRSRFSC